MAGGRSVHRVREEGLWAGHCGTCLLQVPKDLRIGLAVFIVLWRLPFKFGLIGPLNI